MRQPQRLQRFLAAAGLTSRRGGEELISSGRVSVNGEVITELGTKVSPDSDIVRVDGVKLSLEEKHLYLFHKPAGVLTTLDDPFKRRCITEFTEALPVRVFPVGRLDLDVIGLLLLTNDGEFANKLMHPRYAVSRTYLAEVRGKPSSDSLKKLTKGISLDDGLGKALRAESCSEREAQASVFASPSGVSPPGADTSVISVSVAEGRNHFVKRILQAIGHPVVRLCRTDFGPYSLGDLAPGEIREIASWSERGQGPDGETLREALAS